LSEDDDQLQMYLTASTTQKYDGTIYSNKYLIQSASTWITASSPYWQSEAIAPIIESSVPSEFAFVSGTVTYGTSSGGSIVTTTGVYGSGVYGTSTYYVDVTGAGFNGVLAAVQSYLPTGQRRMKYDGAKMTSPANNVDSPHTIDGGPVVEWRATNPNQLIYTENGDQGSFLLQ
jgi:hypothetical protein